MNDKKAWEILNTDSLTSNHLHELMLGNYAAVAINNFYREEWCNIATRAIQNAPFKKKYIQDNVDCWYLGESLVEAKYDIKTYFFNSKNTMLCIRNLFLENDIPSPLEIAVKLFSEIWPGGASIAHENGNEYFAGIIRAIRRSPLHNDNARRDFPNLLISLICYQLSWNVFLNITDHEQGSTQIWQKEWQPDDEKFKHFSEKMMGYTYDVVKDSPSCILQPVQGQLVIINPQFYHEVHLSYEIRERITMSSFIGANTMMDPLILWS